MRNTIISLILTALLFVVPRLSAQCLYDALRVVNDEPIGTARFVGMGGAMSALGADISTISTNPAGIGVYRSYDATLSAAVNFTGKKSNHSGTGSSCNDCSFAVENAGFVIATPVWDCHVKYINVAFNYRRSKSFAGELTAAGSLMGDDVVFSQQYELQEFCLLRNTDGVGWDFCSLHEPWLGLMYSASGLWSNETYMPVDAFRYQSRERGGTDEVEANVACNINDRIYIGLTAVAAIIDYSKTTSYGELCSGDEVYTLTRRRGIEGEGTGLKLGAIVRPIDGSPLRVGFYVHTPIKYRLTERSWARLENGEISFDTRSAEGYGEELLTDYRISTPWRINLSAAYTVEECVAVDAEYEFVDYSSAKIKYADGDDIAELCNGMEDCFKKRHIVRVGVLYNVNDCVSLCCGYNHLSSPCKRAAEKLPAVMMTHDTATEFENLRETNIFTLGAGFSGKRFYADAACRCSMTKSDFFTYSDPDYDNTATKIDTRCFSFYLSAGWKF